MMKVIHTLLLLVFLSIGISQRLAWGASADFRYDTGRLTPIDVTLANTGNQQALLSFYSEGENGLRLLENSFTDSQGHYAGQLLLPIHLTQIIMIVRTNERQNTLTLPIVNDAISFIE